MVAGRHGRTLPALVPKLPINSESAPCARWDTNGRGVPAKQGGRAPFCECRECGECFSISISLLDFSNDLDIGKHSQHSHEFRFHSSFQSFADGECRGSNTHN